MEGNRLEALLGRVAGQFLVPSTDPLWHELLFASSDEVLALQALDVQSFVIGLEKNASCSCNLRTLLLKAAAAVAPRHPPHLEPANLRGALASLYLVRIIFTAMAVRSPSSSPPMAAADVEASQPLLEAAALLCGARDLPRRLHSLALEAIHMLLAALSPQLYGGDYVLLEEILRPTACGNRSFVRGVLHRYSQWPRHSSATAAITAATARSAGTALVRESHPSSAAVEAGNAIKIGPISAVTAVAAALLYFFRVVLSGGMLAAREGYRTGGTGENGLRGGSVDVAERGALGPPLVERGLLLLLVLAHNRQGGASGLANPVWAALCTLSDSEDYSSSQTAPAAAAAAGLLPTGTAAGTKKAKQQQALPPLPPVRIPFHKLFRALSTSLATADEMGGAREREAATLLLYSFLQASRDFRSAALVRSDSDALLLPLLRVLYDAGGVQSASRLYLTVVVCLLLTQDAAFCNSAFRRTSVPDVPWHTSRRLNDVSLGSLIILCVLRALSANLASRGLRDVYLQQNLCAVLLNLAPHLERLHCYAAQRLVDVLLACAKRWTMMRERRIVRLINGSSSVAAVAGATSPAAVTPRCAGEPATGVSAAAITPRGTRGWAAQHCMPSAAAAATERPLRPVSPALRPRDRGAASWEASGRSRSGSRDGGAAAAVSENRRSIEAVAGRHVRRPSDVSGSRGGSFDSASGDAELSHLSSTRSGPPSTRSGPPSAVSVTDSFAAVAAAGHAGDSSAGAAAGDKASARVGGSGSYLDLADTGGDGGRGGGSSGGDAALLEALSAEATRTLLTVVGTAVRAARLPDNTQLLYALLHERPRLERLLGLSVFLAESSTSTALPSASVSPMTAAAAAAAAATVTSAVAAAAATAEEEAALTARAWAGALPEVLLHFWALLEAREGSLTSEEAAELILRGARHYVTEAGEGGVGDGRETDAKLAFEEGADPAAFFVPCAWEAAVSCTRDLCWHSRRVVLFPMPGGIAAENGAHSWVNSTTADHSCEGSVDRPVEDFGGDGSRDGHARADSGGSNVSGGGGGSGGRRWLQWRGGSKPAEEKNQNASEESIAGEDAV